MNFKLSGIGLDTTNLINIGLKPGENKLNYFHTSIRANNEHLVKGVVGPNTVLVTTVDCLDNIKNILTNHLDIVRGNSYFGVNLLLIPCDLENREEYVDQLKELVSAGIIKNIGISKPNSIKELKSALSILEKHGLTANWVSLDICPLHFNYAVINWCNENNKEIIGFNPFGGHLTAPTLIESFTASYLLSFAAVYSSVIFLSSRNLDMSYDEADYLNGLIGSEVSARYILRKSVNQLTKQPKEIVTSDLIIKEGVRVPIDIPELSYLPKDIRHNFGKALPEINVDVWNDDPIIDEIKSLCEDIKTPEDGNYLDRLVLLKSGIQAHIESTWPDAEVTVEKLGKCIYAFIATTDKVIKKHWWSQKVHEVTVRRFILFYDVNDEKLSFFEMDTENESYKDSEIDKTADEMPENSNI